MEPLATEPLVVLASASPIVGELLGEKRIVVCHRATGSASGPRRMSAPTRGIERHPRSLTDPFVRSLSGRDSRTARKPAHALATTADAFHGGCRVSRGAVRRGFVAQAAGRPRPCRWMAFSGDARRLALVPAVDSAGLPMATISPRIATRPTVDAYWPCGAAVACVGTRPFYSTAVPARPASRSRTRRAWPVAPMRS